MLDDIVDRAEAEIEAVLADPFLWGPLLVTWARGQQGRLTADDFRAAMHRFRRDAARAVASRLQVRLVVEEDLDDVPTQVIRRTPEMRAAQRLAWEDTAVQEVGRGA